MSGKNIAAVYCRLSEEDRDKTDPEQDSVSIQNQKSMLLKYAAANGWEVYDIYSDEDYCGADRNRPEFQRLLKDAQQNKFNILLCKSQSRFTREIELVEKYIHTLFPIWGIRFVGMIDNADTAVAGNKKARQINGLVNEWYLEDLSVNIKGVLTDRRENGYHIGSFALYGYRKDPENRGRLLVDEEAAGVVREVFDLFIKGHGKMEIARILNERGVPNPTEYKRRKGLRYKGAEHKNSTLWNYYAIADMLQNEMYIGNMIQGKYENISYKTKQSRPVPRERWIRVEGTHEAVIDKAVWQKAQERIKERSRPFAASEHTGIFARKTRCMYCGYTLRSSKVRQYYYLRCTSRHKMQSACKGAFVAQRFLEKAVLKELKDLVQLYLDPEEAQKYIELADTAEEEYEKEKRAAFACEKKMEDCDSYLTDAYIDKAKGMISPEEYEVIAVRLRREKQDCSRKLERHKKRTQELEKRKMNNASKSRLIGQYMNMEQLDREFVNLLIDYIEVGRKEQDTGEVPIIIHWNF